MIYQPNSKYKINFTGSTQEYNLGFIYCDWLPTNDSKRMNAVVKTSTQQRFIKYIFDSTKQNAGYNSGYTDPVIVKTIGHRRLINNVDFGTNKMGAFINQHGETYLLHAYSSATAYNIGFSTDLTMYVSSITSTTKYVLDCYMKVYDKIIKKCVEYNNGTYTILSTTEVGAYDKYFRGKNNDYFVVNDNVLKYFADRPINAGTTE